MVSALRGHTKRDGLLQIMALTMDIIALMEEKNPRRDMPHPEKKPKYPGALELKNLSAVFSGCADFETRTVMPGLSRGMDCVALCWLDGLVDGVTVSAVHFMSLLYSTVAG